MTVQRPRRPGPRGIEQPERRRPRVPPDQPRGQPPALPPRLGPATAARAARRRSARRPGLGGRPAPRDRADLERSRRRVGRPLHRTRARRGVRGARLARHLCRPARRRPGEVPADADLAVVLTDSWDIRAFPASTILCAWVRNWTERWLTRPWLDRYDVLLASSERSSAELLREATGRPAELFPLATNPRRFRPATGARSLDWVFTGNRWGEPRAIEAALAGRRRRAGRDLRPRLGGGRAPAWTRPRTGRPTTSFPRSTAPPGSCSTTPPSRRSPTTPSTRVCSTRSRAGRSWSRTASAVCMSCSTRSSRPGRRPRSCAQRVERLLGDPGRASRSPGATAHRARAPHLRASRSAAALAPARAERAAVVLPEDRRAGLGAGRALGRSALRRRARAGAAPARPPLAGRRAAGVGQPRELDVRRRSPPPRPLGVRADARPVQRAVADQPSGDVRPDGRRRLRPRVRRLGRVRARARRAGRGSRPRARAGDRSARVLPRLRPGARPRARVRRQLPRRAARRSSTTCSPPGATSPCGAAAGRARRRATISPASTSPTTSCAASTARPAIVLCDHWPDMRAAGFRSNRLYDALACGALVVCDRVAGLDGSLGDAVLTYEGRAELRPLIERAARRPRRARAPNGRRPRSRPGRRDVRRPRAGAARLGQGRPRRRRLSRPPARRHPESPRAVVGILGRR